VSPVPVNEENFPACVSLVSAREPFCVALAGKIAVDGIPRLPPAQSSRLTAVADESGTPRALLHHASSGIVLHCIDESAHPSGLAGALRAFLAEREVRCVMGERAGTLLIEAQLPVAPSRAVEYELLALPADWDPTPPRPLPDGLLVDRATSTDVDGLLPLQTLYEREEVIPPGDPFDPETCRASLRASLASQLVYLARADGHPVAKAGTNARGLSWDQVGGVFTLPDWRGRGLATALVSHLAADRVGAGRRMCLFVKPANERARRAYARVGFVHSGSFRISYY
jgi:GNAT superfamily N-acetyltransferase